MTKKKINYGTAIRDAFVYLLKTYPDVMVMGQGLWSPWYVGNTMTELDKTFGENRIMDTPVSESACTGIAVGASLAELRPIVVHPRMDFMLYAMDAIVNQAAKWSHMSGGQASPKVTIRGIINRGGEQGAQHSQALHSWFTHVPGLRVVMPSVVSDARDLLIASVLCDDPVIYIDDRWLYDNEAELGAIQEIDLSQEGPKILQEGRDVTLVSCGYGTHLCLEAHKALSEQGVSAEIIDLRVLTPFKHQIIVESLKKTGRLIAIDIGTLTSGFAAEIIAKTMEDIPLSCLKNSPSRITLPDAPAPTASNLEKNYYFTSNDIVAKVLSMMSSSH